MWYDYLAYFLGGVFLANGFPHFFNGISGNKFQSPFAKPSGVGESSPLVNVLWGGVSFFYWVCAHLPSRPLSFWYYY